MKGVEADRFPFRYNGQMPDGDRSRRRSKFELRQRVQPNGLKAQQQHLCQNADEVKVTSFFHHRQSEQTEMKEEKVRICLEIHGN